DGIRDYKVTGVQTCALPISLKRLGRVVSLSSSRRYSRLTAKRVWMPVLSITGCPNRSERNLANSADVVFREVMVDQNLPSYEMRSEERRVGKEWRCRW